jgi:hypothetical protein
MPMTVAMDLIMRVIPLIIDREKVCDGCRDKTRCADCSFSQEKHRNCQELINIIRKGEIDHVGNDHIGEGL